MESTAQVPLTTEMLLPPAAATPHWSVRDEEKLWSALQVVARIVHSEANRMNNAAYMEGGAK